MSDVCIRALEAFDGAYSAYQPRRALEGTAVPSVEARRALRKAVDAVRKATPSCKLGFGRKVKVACIVGVHARIIRNSPWRDPYAANLYDHFWSQLSPVEPWYLAGVAGFRYSPGECGSVGGKGNFIVSSAFIDELLHFAGPVWRAEIAVDANRLNMRFDRRIT